MFTCVIIGAEILLAFLLQTTVFASLTIAGVGPNILMMVTSAIGYQFGKLQGMACGFFCGLLIDISTDSILGVNALFFMLIGYANGQLNKYYVKNDVFIPLALVAASQLSFSMCIYVFDFLVRSRSDVFYYFKRIMVPGVLYTTILSILIYRILDWIYNGVIIRYRKKEE